MAEAEERHATSSWGTPDPRDADAYPPVSAASLEQWAWEFLRRREDYRKRWSESVRPFIDGNNGFDFALVLRDNKAALHRGHWIAPWNALCDKFGVSGNPTADAIRFNITLDPRRAAPPWFEGLCVATVSNRPTAPGKLQFEIDRTLPIKRQLEQIRQSLHQPEEPHRLQVDKFPRYLRLLDFDAARAPDEEIGKYLFPDASGERLSDSIRKSFEAARRWQDDYLLIALT